MLKEIVASNAAKLIAACVCPVATTAALTVAVPQVRQAIHKATAPRAYAKPKTRVRQPAAAAAPRLASALPECPPAVMIGNSTIAPNLMPFALPPAQLASTEGGGGGPGGPGGWGYPGGSGGPGGPGWIPGSNEPPVVEPPAVPEPETWVQMLIGFGVIGGATRVTYRQQRRLKPEADV